VVSGEVIGDVVNEATLRVCDLDLNEVARHVVRPALKLTGHLTAIGKDQLLGVTRVQGKPILYLFDLGEKGVTKWRELDAGSASAPFLDAENDQLWIVLGRTLCRLDPLTLETLPVATLSRGMGKMLWRDGVLFGAAGGELLRADARAIEKD